MLPGRGILQPFLATKKKQQKQLYQTIDFKLQVVKKGSYKRKLLVKKQGKKPWCKRGKNEHSENLDTNIKPPQGQL